MIRIDAFLGVHNLVWRSLLPVLLIPLLLQGAALSTPNRKLTSTALRFTNQKMKALILGAFDGSANSGDQKINTLTPNANAVNSKLDNVLVKNLQLLGPLKKGKTRLLQGVAGDYPVISLVSAGPQDAGVNPVEHLNEKKENVRLAVADGLKNIRSLDLENLDEVHVDSMGEPQAAAEAVYLSDFRLDELKSEKSRRKPLKFSLFNGDPDSIAAWDKGRILAEGQNMARRLADMPANLMTPTIFADEVSKAVANTSIKLIVRDKDWIEKMKMGSFLSVNQGSDQPPKFLEIHYNNNPGTKPLVFVGKGITFDSGGYSLKPPANMDEMRADMTGAAIVASTIVTLARLNAKVNIIGLTPLTENLINGHASKPGDVFRAMNGKTIKVDNTDAEGRLVLADALTYADTLDPQAVVDIATLTGAMRIAFGDVLAGIWSNSDQLWNKIYNASVDTGDRVWRMPLLKAYTKEVTDTHLADLNNMGKTARSAGSSVAAAFLKEFTTSANWMHIDIASTFWSSSDKGYLSAGMTARPFRTVFKFFEDYHN